MKRDMRQLYEAYIYAKNCTYTDIDEFVKACVKSEYKTVKKQKNKKKFEYLNVACAFDIETTSVNKKGEKAGFMYIWQFGFNGLCIYGRTWADFILLMKKLKTALDISLEKRLICFVHNLDFEFQFLRKRIEWEEVFCTDNRAVLFALAKSGIEFRCSAKLFNCKLQNLKGTKTKKLMGDLDYHKKRNSKTKLNYKELAYCINDIRVLMEAVENAITEKRKNIGFLPLTYTGYVRNDVREAMRENKETASVKKLTIENEEYDKLLIAFQGGYVHANANYCEMTIPNVSSFDITSSYPAVMCSEYVPMSKGQKVIVKDKKEFIKYITEYCCLITLIMEDVKLKDGMGDAPISKSKVKTDVRHCGSDNGRIRNCKRLLTTITEQDFFTYIEFYNFHFKIVDMWIYEKGFLPKTIIEKVLEYYEKKTKLKDVEGEEFEYNKNKRNVNSIFGMMVQKPISDRYFCDGQQWFELESGALEEYNNSKSRFLFFPWGVWITAHARRNLFKAIKECGMDYIYSDTDCTKTRNRKKHEQFFKDYNEEIKEKINYCLDYYGIDKSKACPSNKNGEQKQLGAWELEDTYDSFKTLGAKRYIYKKGDCCYTTIAGVDKTKGCEYFNTLKDPMEEFEEDIIIPADKTGKLGSFYNDEIITMLITDEEGNSEWMTEQSSIYLEPVKFQLGISDEYETMLYLLQNRKDK